MSRRRLFIMLLLATLAPFGVVVAAAVGWLLVQDPAPAVSGGTLAMASVIVITTVALTWSCCHRIAVSLVPPTRPIHPSPENLATIVQQITGSVRTPVPSDDSALTAERQHAADMLRAVATGVSAEIGDAFFRSLVEHLAGVLGARYAFVGELVPNQDKSVQTLAVFAKGTVAENFAYALADTPCENVVDRKVCVHPCNVCEDFPKDDLLREMGVESYAGLPLVDSRGQVIGLLVVLDTKPISDRENTESLLRIFANRASAELERKHDQDRQQRMKSELDHRVKNTLAAVLSLAEQTAATADSIDDFKDRYTGRIRSMASTHEALAAKRWVAVDLQTIAEAVLGPVLGHGATRVTLAGESVELRPEAATPFGLTLHELTTNSIKYGALSTPDGHVHVEWAIQDGDDLQLEWIERGGPSIDVPPREGFGLTMIRGLIEHELMGHAEISFESSGVRATLTFPLRTHVDVTVH